MRTRMNMKNMARLLPASGRARAVVVVCAALLALVALLHALSWRDARFAEAFEVVPNVDMSVARHPKSLQYARAGLRHFFSDGSDTTTEFLSDAIFFSPSSNDVICRLGSSSVTGACAGARTRIDSVSCRDRTTLLRSSADCSSEAITSSKEPMAAGDCGVRLWEGHYQFVKGCLTLAQTKVRNDQIRLPAGEYTTKAAVLLRPCFLTGPLSKLYAVDYGTAVGDSANSLSDYDSARAGSPVVIPLSRVSDELLVDAREGMELLTSAQLLRGDRAGYGARDGAPPPPDPTESVALPTTLYYLNFVQRALNPPAPYRVLTLFMRTPRDPKTAPPLNFRAVPQLAVSSSGDGVQVQVAGGRAYSVPLLADGMLVVTYTTNLLIIATFNKQRVVLRRVGGVPHLRLSPDQFAKAAAAAPPPPEAFPYTNACIPNLADLATKLGMLG